MNLTENTQDTTHKGLDDVHSAMRQVLAFQKVMDNLGIEPPSLLTNVTLDNEIERISVIHEDSEVTLLNKTMHGETINTTVLQTYVTNIHKWLENDIEGIRILTKLLNAEEYFVAKGSILHNYKVYNLPKTINEVLLIGIELGGTEC